MLYCRHERKRALQTHNREKTVRRIPFRRSGGADQAAGGRPDRRAAGSRLSGSQSQADEGTGRDRRARRDPRRAGVRHAVRHDLHGV